MIQVKRKQREGIRSSFGTMELSHLEWTIICSFFPEGKNITIKEIQIQERVDYSYERVNTALKSLTKKKIVKEEQKGKTLVYSLDFDNLYAKTGFSHYMMEREIEFIKKHKIVYNAIKEIRDNPYIWGIVLFGSYSKGTETKQSDVDLICISNKKEETEHFVKSLRYKYNINFVPVVLPLHEFPNIKKDNPELWNDLKMYGIAFKGGDYFYPWMYKNEKGN